MSAGRTIHYLDSLAEFGSGLRLADVPENIQHIAKLHILDTTGVIVGGTVADPVRKTATRLRNGTPEGAGTSTVLGLGTKLRPRDSAFVHGTAGTWLDFDLGHRWSGGHPSIHVLAASLGLAESLGCPGEDLLTAFIAGSEVACRIGVAIPGLAAGLHPHGSWPVFGAVIAAGRLAGLTPFDLRRAMEIVSTLTLVTSWRTAFGGATVRNSYAGFGAELAVRSVELVRAGWEGEPDGVGVVFGGIATSGINRRRTTVELGKRWEFATSYYKPYSFARFGHAAVDIVKQLQAEHGFASSDVDRIEVRTYRLGGLMREQHPENELAARFSTPQALGALLVLGRCGPDEFRGEALQNPEIREVAGRVYVTEDGEWEGINPAWRGATVRVVLKNGGELAAEAEQTLGDPENPLSEADLVQKFRDVASPVIGEAASALAAARLLRLEMLRGLPGLVEGLLPSNAA